MIETRHRQSIDRTIKFHFEDIRPLASTAKQAAMAVDSFFEDSSRKRKRERGGPSSSSGRVRGSRENGRVHGRSNGSSFKGKGKGREDNHTSSSARRREQNDEEIEGSEDDEDEDESDADGRGMNGIGQDEEFESENEAERKETPAQKRLRLAQQYLDSLKAAQSGVCVHAVSLQPLAYLQMQKIGTVID